MEITSALRNLKLRHSSVRLLLALALPIFAMPSLALADEHTEQSPSPDTEAKPFAVSDEQINDLLDVNHLAEARLGVVSGGGWSAAIVGNSGNNIFAQLGAVFGKKSQVSGISKTLPIDIGADVSYRLGFDTNDRARDSGFHIEFGAGIWYISKLNAVINPSGTTTDVSRLIIGSWLLGASYEFGNGSITAGYHSRRGLEFGGGFAY